MITFEDYQAFTPSTATYPKGRLMGLIYTSIGLVGEAGEVAGKISKIIRDDELTVTDKRKKEIADELGDCLWFISQTCNELNIKMSDVAEKNIEKLRSRQERNKISGSGDNR